MKVSCNGVELIIKNGIKARLADVVVEVSGKTEPRRCESIEVTNVGGHRGQRVWHVQLT